MKNPEWIEDEAAAIAKQSLDLAMRLQGLLENLDWARGEEDRNRRDGAPQVEIDWARSLAAQMVAEITEIVEAHSGFIIRRPA